MTAQLTCADCGAKMVRVRGSLPQGKARCHPCRRARPVRSSAQPDGPTCSSCGRRMWAGDSTLPQGEATCIPCRSERRGKAERDRRRKQDAALQYLECPTCGDTFRQWIRTQVYCTPACRDARTGWNHAPTTPNPKYRSRAHRAERRRLERQMERDGYLTCAQPDCLEPSRTIDQGEAWHVGHDDSGTAYLGAVHARCNVVDGAKRGRARRDDSAPTAWAL